MKIQNSKLKIQILLLFIIFFAAVLRLWNLGNVPISPDWDEAALGYNAYAIYHTGRDEYGKFLPVILKSFDDYKPALYTYTIIPFLPLFDLSLVAVRLPSALFGILTVFMTYLLVKELFKRQELALVSSFFLAISPWHIQFSRVAFETNLGLTCNVLAAFFFVKALKKPLLFSFSTAFAALSIYAYQSEKVFVPLFFLMLLGVFYKEVLAVPRKYLIAAFITGFFVMLPMVVTIAFDHHSLSRAKQTSIFAKQTDLSDRYEKRMSIDQEKGDVLGLLFDNKPLYFVKVVFGGYISHFDLNWLFIKGDIERHHAPGMGLLYLFELPLLFIGLYMLLFSKEYERKGKFVIFLWFLLAPIPASITTDVPHAVRTLNFLPTFQVFIAIGALTLFFFLKKQRKIVGYSMGALFMCFALFNFLYYLNQYFVQQNYFNSKNWQYGYEDIISHVATEQNKHEHIVISDVVPMDQSYIFYLFYTKYDPARYQKNATRGTIDYSLKLDKITFKKIDWNKDSLQPRTLLVGTEKDFPKDTPLLYTKDYLDGTPGMRIVETK